MLSWMKGFIPFMKQAFIVKTWLDQRVSRLLYFVYSNCRYKIAMFVGYLLIHCHFIIKTRGTFSGYVHQILFYEIWWYFIDLAIIIFPYLLLKLFNCEARHMHEKVEMDEHAFQSPAAVSLYELLVILALSISIYGIITKATTLTFIYGLSYGLILLFPVGMFFMGPCLINLFVVILKLWEKIGSIFGSITHMNGLLAGATYCIKIYRRLNKLFISLYLYILILSTFAYTLSDTYQNFISAVMARKIDYNLLMALAVYGIAAATPISYSLYFGKKIQGLLIQAIISINLTQPLEDSSWALIQLVFFDRNSPYYIKNTLLPLITSAFSTVFVPLASMILENFMFPAS